MSQDSGQIKGGVDPGILVYDLLVHSPIISKVIVLPSTRPGISKSRCHFSKEIPYLRQGFKGHFKDLAAVSCLTLHLCFHTYLVPGFPEAFCCPVEGLGLLLVCLPFCKLLFFNFSAL
jgi:hypothetical protein